MTYTQCSPSCADWLPPVRTAEPAVLVTIEELKRQCRVDHDEENDYLLACGAAATEHLDGWSGILGRALVEQTWRQDFPAFCDRLRLPLGPVQSIASIKYFDADEAEQTVPAETYALVTDGLGARIDLVSGADWPSPVYDRADAVRITFVAGYGAAAAVPAPIRQAALLYAAHLYEHREAVGPGDLKDVPMAVDRLIAPYRRIGV